jgi:hypothetical protein
MRIFAVSDLHTDFRANRALLDELPRREHRRDVLLVAGDIADRLTVIGDTLGVLRSRFSEVFYAPGNHELWVRDGRCDSLEKLGEVLRLCERLGVRTGPAPVGGVWVVPLFSWYSPGFDDGGEEADPEEMAGWADDYFCKWPADIHSVVEYFLKMNEPRVRRYDGPVISLSHFLPRRDLLPPTSELLFKGLPKVAGCVGLEAQIRRLRSAVHVFGHSHINCDLVIDGVRYVQNALRYPRERGDGGFPLKTVWESEEPAGPHARV